MKYLKMLGLAAVAAMGLMAFLGASSASGTVLCSTTTTPCGATWKWPLNTVIKASLDPETPNSTAVLRNTNGFIEDTCTGSTVEGKITNAGGAAATVVGKVTSLGFTNCTQTTVPNNAATCELEVHSITGSSNGTVTAKGCTVTILFPPVTCTLGASTGIHLGTLTEGNPATLDVNANVVTVDGDSSLCPATGKWEAKYQITEPKNTTLAVEPE